jgi:DNA-binding response OmpR family regulator
MIKILVVDKDETHAKLILDGLDAGSYEVASIPHSGRASNHVRNNRYDLIILGDKLNGGGDTYDVGLEIKNSNVNSHSSVICITTNVSRTVNLAGLLAPYAIIVNPDDPKSVSVCVGRIKDLISPEKKKK